MFDPRRVYQCKTKRLGLHLTNGLKYVGMFIDKNKLAEKQRKDFFYNAYYGDFGSFFDPRSFDDKRVQDSCHEMLTRVKEIVKARKSDTCRQFLPIVTNYYESITSLKLDYIFGEGANVISENDQFIDWLSDIGARDMSYCALGEAMATGYSGFIPAIEDDQLSIEQFDYRRFYQDEDGYYLYSTEEVESGAQYVYLVSILETDAGWQIVRQAFEKDHDAENTLGRQVPLSVIFPEIEEEEIVDPKVYQNVPLFVYTSHVKSPFDIADSIYRDVNSHVQALIVYDIFTTVELQQHFFSSMVLPAQMTKPDPKTGRIEALANTQFIRSDGSFNPYFISKEIKEHYDVMKDHKQDLLKAIAIQTKVPAQLLMKDNGSERRVEIAKQDNLPFYLNTMQYQDKLKKAYEWMAIMYSEFYNQEVVVTVIPDKSFVRDDVNTRELRLQQRTSGNLSLVDYYGMEFPELTTDQIEEMVGRLQDEQLQVNRSISGSVIDSI